MGYTIYQNKLKAYKDYTAKINNIHLTYSFNMNHIYNS